MSRPPTISAKETEILELLSEHDQLYGLQLVEKSKKGLKRGTVYVTLNRLEDEGLIKSKVVAPKKGEQGPSRRVYRITGSGERVFNAWREYGIRLGLQ